MREANHMKQPASPPVARPAVPRLATALVAAIVCAAMSGSARAQEPPGMDMDHMHDGMNHAPAGAPPPSAGDLDFRRNASGTAWQPETTPHAALHAQLGGFQLMLHGLFFAAYDFQGSDRGDHEPMAVGWLMGMASRKIAASRITARVMLSPEPWTAGYRGGGYPLLLQTGETVDGMPLHDRQHPHDLFMEVAAIYTQGLGEDVALQVYVAPAGEPALGPVAFPHRSSAAADPLATITHHWQDATHISFGVATLGVATRWAKLEGSWFNGREPDETRYDFDLRRPDSYAARLSVAPAPTVSAQVSYGYLASPEALRPMTAVHRVTASVTVDQPRVAGAHWTSTLAAGANKESDDAWSPSLMLESSVGLSAHDLVFGRVELVQKSGFDLALPVELADAHFWMGSLGLGYLRTFGPLGALLPGLGVRGQVAALSADLRPFYGTRTPVGALVYLRFTVAPMAH